MVVSPAWIQTQMHAQRKFLHGALCVLFAVGLRWTKVLKPADSAVLSKVTFQLMLPFLLFASIWKAPLSADLWRVGVSSFVTHSALILVVLCLAPFVFKEGSFRGQCIMSMLGNNLAFAYPLVLAVEEFRDTLFPALVVWDVCGNAITVLVVNYIIAYSYAPPPEKNAQEEKEIMMTRRPSSTEPVRRNTAEFRTESVRPGEPTVIGRSMSKGSSDEANTKGKPKPHQAWGPGEAVVSNQVEYVDSVLPGEPNLLEANSAATSSPSSGLNSIGKAARRLIWKLCTNPQILAISLALVVNCTGIHIPDVIDEFCGIMGQPFSVLFFVVLGLNLEWAVIRPRMPWVLSIIGARLVLGGALAAANWVLPLVQDENSKKGVLLGLMCPASGMTLGYSLNFNYDARLQAVLITNSNVISFMMLAVLMVTA